MRLAPACILLSAGLILFAAWATPAADAPSSPDKPADPWPVGIEKRLPLTTSHVAGSPNPPLPFRVKPAFPKLKISCPIAVTNEPGSDRLLILHQDWAWGGQGRLLRVKDDPATDKADKLLDIDGIAYGLTFHPDFAQNGYI